MQDRHHEQLFRRGCRSKAVPVSPGDNPSKTRGSWASYAKPLPFVSSLVTRTDKPCSVPSFGLIPADGVRPWPAHGARRRCRRVSPVTVGHPNTAGQRAPRLARPLAPRLETHGVRSFVQYQAFLSAPKTLVFADGQ